MDVPLELRSQRARAAALGEVLLACALVFLAYRAFRTFTPLGRAEVRAGLVYSPGLVMILACVAALALRRVDPTAFRWSARGPGAALGLAAAALLAAGGALLWALGLRHAVGAPMGRELALAASALHVVAALLLLRSMPRRASALARGERASLALVLLVLALPLAAALLDGRPLVMPARTLGWIVVVAVGEEAFFRGYVQARVDAAFGRPLRLGDTRIGAGLVVAALLFGAVHVLNPFDPFTGAGELAWWHGLATATALYGLLQARSGGLGAPIVLHLLVDLVPRLPALL